jgi:hypothetical protein
MARKAAAVKGEKMACTLNARIFHAAFYTLKHIQISNGNIGWYIDTICWNNLKRCNFLKTDNLL